MKKLKQDSILRLYKLVADNENTTFEHYKDLNEFKFNFLESEFENDNNFEINNIDNIALKMMQSADRNDNSEFQVAKILWENTKYLTPYQASDIGFWNYLNHFTFYSFLQKRWPINNINDILNHYIQKSSSQASLIDYTLSGYWWSIYLTVDYKRENPFELTEILFQNSSFRTKNFGGTKIFRHRDAVIGTLEFIAENNLNKSNFEDNSRAISVFLTLLGGTKPLGYFDKDWFKAKLNLKFKNDILSHGRLFQRDDREKFLEKNNFKNEKASEILRFFNLNNSSDYKLSPDKNLNYDFSIPIYDCQNEGFLLQCYTNGRINKVDIRTLLNKALNNNYLNGKSKFDIKLLTIIDKEQLVLLITKTNNQTFVKIHKTEWITTHDNLILMGNEITKDLENLEYVILPIELEKELKKLTFKSSRANSISTTHKNYSKEWEVLKDYLT